MDLINPEEIERGKRRFRRATNHLDGYKQMVLDADWETPHDALQSRGGVDILGDGLLCFNIMGNSYRLIARVNYVLKTFEILFLDTHKKYDKLKIRRLRR